MNYAASTELRRKLYVIRLQRAEQNEEILRQILTLRQEKAKLIGYDSCGRLHHRRQDDQEGETT